MRQIFFLFFFLGGGGGEEEREGTPHEIRNLKWKGSWKVGSFVPVKNILVHSPYKPFEISQQLRSYLCRRSLKIPTKVQRSRGRRGFKPKIFQKGKEGGITQYHPFMTTAHQNILNCMFFEQVFVVDTTIAHLPSCVAIFPL